jgi:hypothetical protein
MRIAAFVLFAGLAGCGSGAPTSLTPIPVAQDVRFAGPDARGGHLYVAVTTSTHYPLVERFRLVGGIPESSPDRVYEGYGELIAVSSDGTLYAFGSYTSGAIYAFAPRGDKPVRTLQIPGPRRCGGTSGEESEISALAADPAGYLFAATYTYDGGVSPRDGGPVPARSGGVPCNGVAIFAPDANGKVQPVKTIGLGHATITGIAVDPNDNLYVAELPNKIVEFANAVTSPQRSRVFHTEAPAHTSSIATDAAGDVFISNVNYGYKTAWIDRYAPSAKAKGPPTSQIRLQGSILHLLPAIAVRRRELFAVDENDAVDLYHALRNGDQTSFYALPANDVSSIAVGP